MERQKNETAAAVTEAQPKVPFKVAISSFLGNFIEWFDYATYTYFAITIGIVFFPESAVNSTLAGNRPLPSLPSLSP